MSPEVAVAIAGGFLDEALDLWVEAPALSADELRAGALARELLREAFGEELDDAATGAIARRFEQAGIRVDWHLRRQLDAVFVRGEFPNAEDFRDAVDRVRRGLARGVR